MRPGTDTRSAQAKVVGGVLHHRFRHRPRVASTAFVSLSALLLTFLGTCAAAAPDQGPAATQPWEVAVPSDDAERLDRLIVFGRRLNLVGAAISASEGSVGQDEIAGRPLLRSGDLLEFVPGLVATQHSGSGKANQYFLRGFNLDHGTDFSTFIDAMPVNMRTHGHGQGWTDLNALIPETVEELAYRKGPYHADVGDFSSTGSARFSIADRVPDGRAELTLGDYGYRRGVLVDSHRIGAGDLLYAAEHQTFDGPWTDINEDVQKTNLLLRYSAEIGSGRGHAMLMAYDNAWNSADQIPQRAVDDVQLSEFGSIDNSVGGAAARYSVSAGWQGAAFGGDFNAEAYAIDSSLDLYSNFTYLLDDPGDGDQFRQVDERQLYGFGLSQHWRHGRSSWRIGADGRYDDIGRVGLFRTRARQPLATVREDAVDEYSIGLHAAHDFRFSDRLRSHLGLRHDRYRFDVDARSLPLNSGRTDDSATSLKGSLIYSPMDPLELYASYGQGFHSNDARGTTIRVDPVSGDAVDAVDPLVDSEGAELGARVYFSERLHATLAAWTLQLDSELLFVGDAGNTEASRPSLRHGFELGLYWFGHGGFNADLEYSQTKARFRDIDAVGREIPGSIPRVVSAGAGFTSQAGWLAAARLRHFDAYPLIEDGSVESEGSTLLNLRIGREWNRMGLYLDVLNALDSDDHDIDYFYASRLAGEPPEGIEDIHFQVFQPRSLRLSARFTF